jgi:hypothetical protein
MTDHLIVQDPDSIAHEEWELASYLSDQVISKASGSDSSECKFTYPRDKYFVGNLRPAGDALNHDNHDAFQAQMNELINKLAPVALGAEFRVHSLEDQFDACIELSWVCYYRVFPTYEQQLAQHSGLATSEESIASDVLEDDTGSGELEPFPQAVDDEGAGGEDSDLEMSSSDRALSRSPKDTLFVRFKKIRARASGCIHFRRDGDSWVSDLGELEAGLQSELHRIQATIRRDEERLRVSGTEDQQVQVPDQVMQSKEEYGHYLNELTEELQLEWDWGIEVQFRAEATESEPPARQLTILLSNTSPMSESSPNIEPFFFEPEARFRFENCEILPFEVELAPTGFRYDRQINARGFNCGVTTIDEGQSVVYVTTNTPSYNQPRLITSTSPEARFSILADDPLPVLRRVEKAMVEYFNVWEEWGGRHSARSDWADKYENEFAQAREVFEQELRRFRRGVEIIENDPDVNLSFRLTNATFARTEKESWRLFQLVFLVSQVAGIAVLNSGNEDDISEREFVDIIYFPTGGGKTEAYLATIVEREASGCDCLDPLSP